MEFHTRNCLSTGNSSGDECVTTVPWVTLSSRHFAKCVTWPSASPCQVCHIDKWITLVMFWLLLVKVVVPVQSVNTWQVCRPYSPVTHSKSILQTCPIYQTCHIYQTWKIYQTFQIYQTWKIYQTCQIYRTWKFVSCSVLSIVLRKNGQWCVYYILHWYSFSSIFHLHILNLYIVIEYED